MLKSMNRFTADESGVTGIESALIAVFIITAVQTVGTKVSTGFNEVGFVEACAHPLRRRSPVSA